MPNSRINRCTSSIGRNGEQKRFTCQFGVWSHKLVEEIFKLNIWVRDQTPVDYSESRDQVPHRARPDSTSYLGITASPSSARLEAVHSATRLQALLFFPPLECDQSCEKRAAPALKFGVWSRPSRIPPPAMNASDFAPRRCGERSPTGASRVTRDCIGAYLKSAFRFRHPPCPICPRARRTTGPAPR